MGPVSFQAFSTSPMAPKQGKQDIPRALGVCVSVCNKFSLQLAIHHYNCEFATGQQGKALTHLFLTPTL